MGQYYIERNHKSGHQAFEIKLYFKLIYTGISSKRSLRPPAVVELDHGMTERSTTPGSISLKAGLAQYRTTPSFCFLESAG
jgi:hypothetical protein